MPRRLSRHVHWDPLSARRELISTTPGAELRVGGVRIVAAAVPLFRRAANGSLEQAIRVRLGESAMMRRVEIAIAAGDRILDTATVETAATASSHHLFVPEVESA